MSTDMDESSNYDEYEDDCPKCDGRGVDKRGQQCGECYGEGVILTLPIARGRMSS